MGIPLNFPDSEDRISDPEWMDEKKLVMEKKLDENDQKKILEGIKDEWDKNLKLPPDTKCNFPGSKFKIDLKDEDPVYTRQYPIPRAL